MSCSLDEDTEEQISVLRHTFGRTDTSAVGGRGDRSSGLSLWLLVAQAVASGCYRRLPPWVCQHTTIPDFCPCRMLHVCLTQGF